MALGLAGCAGLDEPDRLGHTTQLAVVEDFTTGTCSTDVVRGLSLQIADEVGCMLPGALVEFTADSGIALGEGVLPFLDEGAAADLYAAAASLDAPLVINSAYRTVAQQYLIVAWFEAGACGITAAADPGASNHESGRALDVDNWADWVAVLGDHGWAHTVPDDEVHFDHLDSADNRGADVLAFQRLWNRNVPDDVLDEDGEFGPMTAARLAMAPADGFAESGCADDPPPGDPATDDGAAGGGLFGGCATGGAGGGSAATLVLFGLGLSLRRRRVA